MPGLEFDDFRELEERFLRETGLGRAEMAGLLCMIMTRMNFKRAVARKVRIWEGSLLGKELKLVETRGSFGSDFCYVLEAVEWEMGLVVRGRAWVGAGDGVSFGSERAGIECTSFEGDEDQYNTDLTLIRLFNLAEYDTKSDPEFMDPWIMQEQDLKMIGGYRGIP